MSGPMATSSTSAAPTTITTVVRAESTENLLSGDPTSQANSGYASDETASLLTPSIIKPLLATQEEGEEAPKLLPPSPQHSTSLPPAILSTQEAPDPVSISLGPEINDVSTAIPQESTRSVPDIELHCRRNDAASGTTVTIGTDNPGCRLRSYLLPHAHSRCRCEHTLQPLARSVSRESVRSIQAASSGAGAVPIATTSGAVTGDIQLPVVLTSTSSPRDSSSRIIRQSSQPESCVHCHHAIPSASLRQLREPADGIAGIAADSLRINGAIRQFKQVIIQTYFIVIVRLSLDFGR